MHCPRCQHANDATASFCEECGTRLAARACGACGAELKPSAKFCPHCGAPVDAAGVAPQPERDPRAYTPRHLADKILQSKSALQGERKHVTVLFCDVKGSMDLAEQLDPEEWHRIMDRFFQILTDGVHRFEGTVNQYTGDGIMALFGAPIAHEDHAQRACYAALHLLESLRAYGNKLRVERGLSFAARMGLNSGEVVVGTIGTDLRMDYTAQGHTVGLAARMEQIAEPGRAYLTEHTARLVSGFVELADVGRTQVKGVRAPVGVYALAGPGAMRTRLDVSRARGLSRFVGRADEMATLETALERALAGPGLTVGVVAEAGTGKSRLCFEFLERCRARGLPVVEARAVAHGKQIPLLPILELLRGYFGIEPRDPDHLVREKVAGRLLLLDERLKGDLPLFFELLGVPDPERPLPALDPEAMQRRMLAGIRGIIHADGQRPLPVVTFVEDLHWIDAASDAYLEQIVQANAATRGLALVNFRPEYRARWMQQSWYQQLPLVPLGPAAVAELLEALLGRDPSVAGLSELVRERTGGNPFFVEEIVRTLVETGALAGGPGTYRLVRPVRDLSVPDTVQAVLAARIDRLGEREKAVLQVAAVIGKTFPERVLRRVLELPDDELRGALRALQEAEFVYEEALFPEVEYGFKHPLTQEVADRSQLGDRRARTHAAVARVIEEVDTGRLDERAALLAHHWDAAGDHAQAARWHARAAEWIGTNDYAEAFRHWRRVDELLREVGDRAELTELRARTWQRLLYLAFRVAVPSEETDAIYAEAQAWLERRGDLRLLASVTCAYAALVQNAGDLGRYLALARQATALADRTDDPAVRAAVRVDLCWSLIVRGLLSEASAVADEVAEITHGDLTLGESQFGYSPFIMTRFMGAYVMMQFGRLAEAQDAMEDAVSLGRAHGPLELLAWSLGFVSWIAWCRGDAALTRRAAREAFDIAERAGSGHPLAAARMWLGMANALAGRWDEAAALFKQALEHAYRGFGGDFHAEMLARLARAHLALGEGARARDLAAEAVALARRQGARPVLCLATVTLAEILRATSGLQAAAEIEAALAETRDVVEDVGARIWLPFVHVEEAALAALRGEIDTEALRLREAHRLFTEMGATGRAERVGKELASRSGASSRVSSTSRT